MDNKTEPARFVRSNKKIPPKGVIYISRRKPRIEAYDNSPPKFVMNFKEIEPAEKTED